MDVMTLIDGDSAFSTLFALEFALMVFFSLLGIVRFMVMDREIRHRYEERAAFMNDFYSIYRERKLKIEEEHRLAEEARMTRLANSVAALMGPR